MTKVWTAQHGWVYLHAIVDCRTRELVGWSVDLRCRDDEAIAVVEAAIVRRRVEPGRLTLGSDYGSQTRCRGDVSARAAPGGRCGRVATGPSPGRPRRSRRP